MFNYIKKLKIDKCFFLGINTSVFAMNKDNNFTFNGDDSNNNITLNNDNIILNNNNITLNNDNDIIIYKTRNVDKVKADGNCFFNLLSNLFFGTEDLNLIIRNYTYNNENKGLSLNDFIAEQNDLIVEQNGLKNLREEEEDLKRDGGFINEYSIVSVSNIFQVNILIHDYVCDIDNKITEKIYKFKKDNDLNSVIHFHLYSKHYFYGSFNLLESKLNDIREKILSSNEYLEFFKPVPNVVFNNISNKDIKEYNKFSNEDNLVINVEDSYNIKNILSNYIKELYYGGMFVENKGKENYLKVIYTFGNTNNNNFYSNINNNNFYNNININNFYIDNDDFSFSSSDSVSESSNDSALNSSNEDNDSDTDKIGNKKIVKESKNKNKHKNKHKNEFLNYELNLSYDNINDESNNIISFVNNINSNDNVEYKSLKNLIYDNQVKEYGNKVNNNENKESKVKKDKEKNMKCSNINLLNKKTKRK